MKWNEIKKKTNQNREEDEETAAAEPQGDELNMTWSFCCGARFEIGFRGTTSHLAACVELFVEGKARYKTRTQPLFCCSQQGLTVYSVATTPQLHAITPL